MLSSANATANSFNSFIFFFKFKFYRSYFYSKLPPPSRTYIINGSTIRQESNFCEPSRLSSNRLHAVEVVAQCGQIGLGIKLPTATPLRRIGAYFTVARSDAVWLTETESIKGRIYSACIAENVQLVDRDHVVNGPHLQNKP